MPESPMAEFWMGSDPGVPLEEVCPIPGMPMPKDGCVIPSDAPGFGNGNQGRVGSPVGPHRGDEGVGVMPTRHSCEGRNPEIRQGR